MEGRMISRKEAALKLSVSIKTIDRWLKDRRIYGFKARGSNRVLIVEDTLTQENLQSPIPNFLNK